MEEKKSIDTEYEKTVYYVVSDVHGYYTEMVEALESAGFFKETRPCKLVLCGDLLDRGKEAVKMIDFMIGLMEEEKLIYIRGNHEDLFVDCLEQIAAGNVCDIVNGMSHHYTNRTWDTMLQISGMNVRNACSYPNELVRRVLNSPFYKRLLPTCVDYYETDNYIFTHGWLPCFVEGLRNFESYTYDPNWREADREGFRRSRWFNGMALACKHRIREEGKTVVCGHWHTSFGHSRIEHACSEWGDDADFSPFSADGILAIDACTAASKVVNCVVIEDGKAQNTLQSF